MTKNTLKSIVGTGVSAIFVWLALRGVAIESVWSALTTVRPLYFALYFVCLVVIHFARTCRWGILLKAQSSDFSRVNAASAIGFMALMILPFRLGEIARPMAVVERGKTSLTSAIASVVVERVTDGATMALVLVGALLFSTPVTSFEELSRMRWGGGIVFAGFLAGTVGLVVVKHQRYRMTSWLSRKSGVFSSTWVQRSANSLRDFADGIHFPAAGEGRFLFFGLTAAYWGFNAGGLMLLARGFGFPLSLPSALALLGLLVVGSLIPSGPGMLGAFQMAIVYGMGLYFPDPQGKASIVAYSWALWVAQFIQQVGFGLYFVFVRTRTWGRLFERDQAK